MNNSKSVFGNRKFPQKKVSRSGVLLTFRTLLQAATLLTFRTLLQTATLLTFCTLLQRATLSASHSHPEADLVIVRAVRMNVRSHTLNDVPHAGVISDLPAQRPFGVRDSRGLAASPAGSSAAATRVVSG